MTVTTALYRRYRPDSFADVIGQEHVTGPLMTALRKNRVNHAYLFSGPRGCGKTTSARILARCLNCAQGPTDTPCGVCPSCVELARGGSGSLDVIEIDAASHGGVDDARDLRERATYAPVRDRYKIFIIDEAHMVTSAGFNALLKIVEEPPEHIKFIFATTEPDKVIGTIRSRTHHYPFRLVPPEPLMAYLELLCNQESVPVAPGVLSLVIRAGAGSVRDSLSVLDQLMAGAGPNGLDYELAVALLGYTHASLLDDVVEAVAAADAATVFRAVDRVIQTGHDPRRFVEDLLERFRDLIIVQAMPESAQAILRGMPADQIARLQNQAHNLGAAELSRAADVTNTALTEMTGATSPRLHLELLCARILLPSSEQNERGIAARIDRVERRLNYAGNDVGAPAGPAAGAAAGAGPAAPAHAAVGAPSAAPASPGPVPPAQEAPAQVSPAQVAPAAGSGTSVPAAQSPGAPAAPAPAAGPTADAASRPAAPATRPAPVSADGDPAGTVPGRTPLTAPRVSTNDWPVDQEGGDRQGTGGTSPAQASPGRSGPETDVAAPGGNGAPGHAGQSAPASARPSAQEGQAPGSHVPAAPHRGQAGPSAAGSAAAPESAGGTPAPAAPTGMGDVEVLRRAWPDVLQTLSRIKRSTWALVEPNAQVVAYDGTVLTLSFTTPGLAGAFGRADHSDNLRQAIHKTVGIDCQINAVAGGTNAVAGGASQASAEPNPKAPASRVATASSADVAWGLAPAPSATAASSDAGIVAGPGTHPQSPAGPGTVAAPSAGNAGGNARGNAGSAVAGAAGTRESLHAKQPGTGAPAGPGHSGAFGGNVNADDTPSAGHPAGEPGGPVPGSQATGSRIPEGQPHAGSGSNAAPATAPAGPANAAGISTGGGATAPATAPASAPAGTSAAAADSDHYPELGGDYSYSDDDWGPPRDEDAPPLEEEPPMDWSPSPTPAGKPSTSGTDAPRPTPVSAPDGGRPGAQPPAASADAHDPWTRAVEQAPGVWVVVSESNVGHNPAPVGAQSDASLPSGSSPVPADGTPAGPSGPDGNRQHRYEPAAAQVPPSIPITAAAGTASPSATASPEPGPAPAPATAPPSSPEPSGTEPQQAREYAMASSAPQSSAAPTTAPAQSTAAATRQSLYQRLSNSPEAEAGRAKAPGRTAAAAATYVQDVPSADDETIEESGVFGRAAVERILGGKLIEERSPDGSPIGPRY